MDNGEFIPKRNIKNFYLRWEEPIKGKALIQFLNDNLLEITKKPKGIYKRKIRIKHVSDTDSFPELKSFLEEIRKKDRYSKPAFSRVVGFKFDTSDIEVFKFQTSTYKTDLRDSKKKREHFCIRYEINEIKGEEIFDKMTYSYWKSHENDIEHGELEEYDKLLEKTLKSKISVKIKGIHPSDQYKSMIITDGHLIFGEIGEYSYFYQTNPNDAYMSELIDYIGDGLKEAGLVKNYTKEFEFSRSAPQRGCCPM